MILAPQDIAPQLLTTLREDPHGRDAAIIGCITDDPVGSIIVETELGTQTLLPEPGGELLPRIC